MIIGLPGDQEAVPFSLIGDGRHLDLLVDTLCETNEALSKMAAGWVYERKENVDYVNSYGADMAVWSIS